MNLQNGLSVVVPVYNSGKSLTELTGRSLSVLQALDIDYEIIYVNDGSRDDSWQIIQTLIADHPCIYGINLMRNYGQHNALIAGIRCSKYRYTVTLDDDLQHPPEEIPKLLEKLREGHDVVYGAPCEKVHGVTRNAASILTKVSLFLVMKVKIGTKISAFRLFKTSLREGFADYQATSPSLDVLLSWATSNFTFVEVDHKPRRYGKSNYSFFKLAGHALAMATGYSTIPLRLASILGFGFTVFGICILLYVLIRFMFEGSPVAGFPFLASIISIFSGVQLFALGIIGEYIARMYTRSMDKPMYVVKEEIDHIGDASRTPSSRSVNQI